MDQRDQAYLVDPAGLEYLVDLEVQVGQPDLIHRQDRQYLTHLEDQSWTHPWANH